MGTYRKKYPEFTAYQYTGDDKAPGWPPEFLFVPVDYTDDGADKAAMVTASDYARPVRKGEWLVYSHRSGEFFPLPDEFFRAHFEEVV